MGPTDASDLRAGRIARTWLAAAILAALALQAFWIARPVERLTTETLVDDAFYYFQTARNVAEGEGSVSSGGVRHNGYHPLWMLVCAAGFRTADLLGGDAAHGFAAIRGLLGLGALLGALTTVLLYAILRGLGCARAPAVLAAALFQWNPFMLRMSVMGLEAPLNAALLAACILWIVRIGERRTLATHYLGLGALFGLLFLTRTDNVFFIGATWLLLVWRARWDRAAWRWLAAAPAAALLIAAPWLLWNLAHFGSIVQGSAGALPAVRETVWFERHPGASETDLLLHRAALFGQWFRSALWYTGMGSVHLLVFAAAAGTLATRRGRGEAPRFALALADLAPLAVAVVCLGAAHKAVRLASREWYFAPSCVLLALVLGLALHYFQRLAKTARARTAVLAAVALLGGLFLVRKQVQDVRGRLAGPTEYALVLLERLDDVPGLRPDEAVGATDSGALGYFAGRPVLNLDGVVNPEAAEAIRTGRLLDYAEARGLRALHVTERMRTGRILGPGWESRLVEARGAEGWFLWRRRAAEGR